jgi:hypothetical protein
VRALLLALTLGLGLTCIITNVPRHTDYTITCS